MKKRNFPIWTILYRNLVWIIIITIAFGVFSYVYSKKKKKPSYTVSTEVLVYPDIDDTQETTASANNNVKLSDLVLSKVIDCFKSTRAEDIINAKISDKENQISTGSIGTSIDSTLIFTMSYTDPSPEKAKKKLTNSIKYFGEWLKESEELEVDIISTGSIAIESLQNIEDYDVSTSTPYTKDAIRGACIGLLLSFVIAVLLYIFDNKIKDEKELEKLTGVKLFSYISNKK